MKTDDLSQRGQALAAHVLWAMEAAHLDALTRAHVEDDLRGVFTYLDANPVVLRMLIEVGESRYPPTVPPTTRLGDMASWHLGKLSLDNPRDREVRAAWIALTDYLDEHAQIADIFVRGVQHLVRMGRWQARRNRG